MTADYTRHAAWSVGPDGTDDADRIVVTAATAALLDTDGADSVPAVEIRFPEAAGAVAGTVRLDAAAADALGRYLIHAARVANEHGADR